MGTLCNIILKEKKEYKWKIKILNTAYYNISVGVAPISFDIGSSYSSCGWYYYLRDSAFRSGPPHNYEFKKTNLNKVKKEIIIIMNINTRQLKFISDDGSDDKVLYDDIPLETPISPAILLYNTNDSIEIIGSE